MKPASRAVRAGIAAAILLNLALPARAQAVIESPQELVVAVRINQAGIDEMLMVLRDAQGGYWLDEEDFPRLRLLRPDVAALEFEGRRYLPLAAVPEVLVRHDEAAALLSIEAAPRAFRTQRLAASDGRQTGPAAASTGLFLNYQVQGQRTGEQSTAGGLAEIGVFGRHGVLTNTAILRHFDSTTRGMRLDTTFTRDLPQHLQTLSLGDGISDAGTWGSSLRFGGLRFAKNFSIRPDLITTPLLSASGTAVVPSAVDVFINNQRVLSEQVQPGPFTIDRLPGAAGAGTVSVVVRDALGREQVLTQPFYTSPTLLAPGLNQYSLAIGALRERYTLAGFDYGNLLASGSFRRGFNDRLTLEAHAEYLAGQARAAGIDVTTQLGRAGVATLTLATGGDAAGNGWLSGVGFERRGNRATFGFSVSHASEGFRRAADPANDDYAPRWRGSAQLGLALGEAGSVSVAFARQSFRQAATEQTVGLTHSARVGRTGSLNLSLTRSLGANPATTGLLTYVASLGGSRSVETTAGRLRETGRDQQTLRGSLTQSAPVGPGHGWRLGADRDGSYEATWQQRLSALDVEVQAVRNFGQTGQSLQLRGAASLLGGQWRAARAIDSSFAVVDVAGLAGVPVYVENQLVAHTDAQGRALLHNLLAYEPNRISIAPEDLPLNTAIDSRSLVIQPAFRSGVVAQFAVQRVYPATFRLLLPDGAPVPVGASVRLNGGDFTVAMQGFTYVTTLSHGVGGSASWAGGRCTFRVDPPPADDPLPDMGTIVCREPAVRLP